jgi:hypothetical protein
MKNRKETSLYQAEASELKSIGRYEAGQKSNESGGTG